MGGVVISFVPLPGNCNANKRNNASAALIEVEDNLIKVILRIDPSSKPNEASLYK